MRDALERLGLDWDGVSLQSSSAERHIEALEALARTGRIYACRCSRSEVRHAGLRAVDGGWRYPGTCRARVIGPDELEDCDAALRLRLDDAEVEPHDEGGLELRQNPLRALGDPVLRRRDGACAYHLASVVDDAALGVTRIVRGRDLAATTATQVVLQDLLGHASPTYRHHLLLLERQGKKLAKLHGSVGWDELRAHYAPDRLCGWLAGTCGLQPDTRATTPQQLLGRFDWSRVRADDVLVRWDGSRLFEDAAG
jgi:glutamyl/glutaminyl-tRNA synthetase